jgi:hypothetical protein
VCNSSAIQTAVLVRGIFMVHEHYVVLSCALSD